MNLFHAKNLIILMTLAGDEDGVVFACLIDREADGLGTVGDHVGGW